MKCRYAFPGTYGHECGATAEAQAERLNRAGYTRNGKFVAGSFTVQSIEGRVPAVVGALAE